MDCITWFAADWFSDGVLFCGKNIAFGNAVGMVAKKDVLNLARLVLQLAEKLPILIVLEPLSALDLSQNEWFRLPKESPSKVLVKVDFNMNLQKHNKVWWQGSPYYLLHA